MSGDLRASFPKVSVLIVQWKDHYISIGTNEKKGQETKILI